MTGIPCRRCGQVTSGMTQIWKPTPNGSLAPHAAECRGRCSKGPATTKTQAAKSPRPAVITAYRPGKCGACGWDIIPGDKMVLAGEGQFVHFECAPANPPEERRVRTRSRTAS